MADEWADFRVPAPQPAVEPPRGAMTTTPGVTRLTVTPTLPPSGESPEGNIGPVGAAALGAMQGATFNFGDELAGLGGGLAAAAPAAFAKASNALLHPADRFAELGKLVYESVTGKSQPSPEQFTGDVTAAFNEARDRWMATVRRANEQAQEQNPKSYLAGNIGASLATLPAGVASAPVRATGMLANLGTRALRGGLTGAVTGGLSGAGEGTTPENRIEQGLAGAKAGGLIGAAVPVIAEPLIRGAGAVGRAVTSSARRMFNPTLQAERQVADIVQGAQERAVAQRARGEAPNTLTRQEMIAAQAAGQPVTVLDTAGRGGQRMARGVRNTPGAEEGTEALEGMVQGRFAGQAARIANFISRMTSGRNATSFEQLRQRATRANRPAYARAYSAGDRPIWSPELERLTGSPDVEAAIKSAVRSGKSRAVEEGFGGFNPGVSVTQDGRIIFGKGPRGTPTYPNIQFWDYVSRDLNDMVQKVQGREPDKARYLNSLSQQLKTELDRLVPEYQAARVGAWRHFQAENAYDAGMKYVTSNATGRDAEELTRLVNGMSGADRVLFRHGFATKLIADVEKTTDNINVVNRIYNSEAARRRIVEALGGNNAQELEAFLRVEAIMNQSRSAVSGGSHTAEQLAFLAGGTLWSAATGSLDWSSALAGAAAVGGKRLAGRANARVADEIGRLLSSQDPDAYRRGIMMIANNAAILDRLRAISQALGSTPQTAKLLTNQGENRPTSQ